MSKSIWIALVVFALAAGAYYYTQVKPGSMAPKDTMMPQEATVKPSEPSMTQEKMMKPVSRYLPFTPASLAETAPTRRVLYFYANWCSTCIPANADFEKNASQLPPDVTVIRVNYNDTDTDTEERALATKYGITYQHTFVQIDEAGEVVTQWNGGATQELLKKLK